jgi:hypothetical protein
LLVRNFNYDSIHFFGEKIAVEVQGIHKKVYVSIVFTLPALEIPGDDQGSRELQPSVP